MSPERSIRRSAIAGTWYPGEPRALAEMIDGFLWPGHTKASAAPIALVCPHAGYAYSGATLGLGYATLTSAAIQRVVIVGPLHRAWPGAQIGAIMAPEEDAFQTPLGNTPVDRAFLEQLGKQVALTTTQGDKEHSIEIQLPFLQRVLPGSFTVVPLLLGFHVSDMAASSLIDGLVAALVAMCDSTTLLVASTDLTHSDDPRLVKRQDLALQSLVSSGDLTGLAAGLRSGHLQACGATGLLVVLQAARALGANRIEVLDYRSSADVTGRHEPGNYTVGYLSAAAYA